MSDTVVLVTIPGLREQDLVNLPTLRALGERGAIKPLAPTFPCVTCPVQTNMLTGVGPEQHGVIANGFYYRDKKEVELWTAWNDCIQTPQIWDMLRAKDPGITSAVWFPMHMKGAAADYICTPAPIHNPDGSESLWCYTKPEQLYGELRDTLGHFPLMNFWGPLANVKSSDWIVESAIFAAERYKPRFSYIYVTHLDYAAQKHGPNSPQADQAVIELEGVLKRLVEGYESAGLGEIKWLFASEYQINEVDSVSYPNRILRKADLLSLEIQEDGTELMIPGESRAWALADHQLAHVFVQDPGDIEPAAAALREDPNIERVLIGDERAELNLNHERSGEIVCLSKPNAWFAYYWWLNDSKAPAFARTVDIHRKPGYDPVEMYINMPEKETPLDATLIRGSHGYPADDASRIGILVSSHDLSEDSYQDTDIAGVVLDSF